MIFLSKLTSFTDVIMNHYHNSQMTNSTWKITSIYKVIQTWRNHIFKCNNKRKQANKHQQSIKVIWLNQPDPGTSEIMQNKTWTNLSGWKRGFKNWHLNHTETNRKKSLSEKVAENETECTRQQLRKRQNWFGG